MAWGYNNLYCSIRITVHPTRLPVLKQEALSGLGTDSIATVPKGC